MVPRPGVPWFSRPGSRRLHRDAAESIFRNETKPAPEPVADAARKEVD